MSFILYLSPKTNFVAGFREKKKANSSFYDTLETQVVLMKY